MTRLHFLYISDGTPSSIPTPSPSPTSLSVVANGPTSRTQTLISEATAPTLGAVPIYRMSFRTLFTHLSVIHFTSFQPQAEQIGSTPADIPHLPHVRKIRRKMRRKIRRKIRRKGRGKTRRATAQAILTRKASIAPLRRIRLNRVNPLHKRHPPMPNP
jgi:hypothetical protein